jgi:hypothetical protein
MNAISEMHSKNRTGEGFDCFREDLLIYLVQRFGSLDLAQKILIETRLQLGDDSILGMVGNPAVYLMGFALSVGLRLTGQMEVHCESLD